MEKEKLFEMAGEVYRNVPGGGGGGGGGGRGGGGLV